MQIRKVVAYLHLFWLIQLLAFWSLLFLVEFWTPVSVLNHHSKFWIKLRDFILQIEVYMFKLSCYFINFGVSLFNLRRNPFNFVIKGSESQILCSSILGLGSSSWPVSVTVDWTKGLVTTFVWGSVCFSKGGNCFWYELDENIMKDWIGGGCIVGWLASCLHGFYWYSFWMSLNLFVWSAKELYCLGHLEAKEAFIGMVPSYDLSFSDIWGVY